ncbi:hypothetical protein [Enterococcus faecalis]|uniref:hypothetical protein n=1 Tax=Enterococcus faecalis TaxID=1351 RepID=UPI00032DC03B|nr:hypothetical protein [Enterococcus faecalis]EOH58723.1 hypothetical protein UA9_03310 [Enterococcus faecalis EnGen0235]
MANNHKDYNQYAGNRYSLRAKTYHMIQRVDFISDRLNSLGDLLVTTWLGLMLSIVTLLGVGGLMIGKIIMANNLATLAKNLPAILLIVIGFILVTLNVLLTNPSMGLQIVVSTKFLLKKFQERKNTGQNKDFRPFRFAEGTNKSVVEQLNKKGSDYLVMYRVKGAVSPVTFQDEMNKLAELNHQLLANIERDTIITTVNSVQSSKVLPKELPANATVAMKKKRDVNYFVASSIKYNQQLDTLVVLSCPSLDILRSRKESVEAVFRKGLVIGYYQLVEKELEREFHTVFG